MIGITVFFITVVSSTFFFIWGYYYGVNKERKRHSLNLYKESLNIFFRWKKEIGGVSLKGVGEYYEKWINRKIQELSSNASYNTKK